MILMLTQDLMMSSNVSAHAREKGVTFKTAPSPRSAMKSIEELKPQVFLVDLQTSCLDVERLGKRIAILSDSKKPLTIAYAPHVHVELLRLAQESGFDQVLTRGQFNAQVSQIVADIT